MDYGESSKLERANMTSGILYHPGLLTNPDVSDSNNTLCGAREHVMRLASLIHATLEVVAWDDRAARGSLAEMQKRFDYVACIGHSHGAWRAAESALLCDEVDMLGLIDECPFADPIEQFMPAIDPPKSVRAGVAVWQRNSQPSGIAYNERDWFSAMDVSLWTPRLGHIDYPSLGLASIAGSDAVWSSIYECVMASFTRKKAICA